MAKAVIITLTEDILEDEQGKDATVTIGDNTYKGKLTTIIIYTPAPQVPAIGKVILVGPGLGSA